MEIYKGIEIVDLGLKYKDTLIVSDFHIGYEEALNQRGVLIPRFQVKDTIERLEKIFSKIKVNKIVITGDLKHEFGFINRQEWNGVLNILDFLKQHGEVILIKGNHDPLLKPLVNRKDVKMVDYYEIDDITILHGDIILPNLKKIVIMGHEHPAVSFKERKDERFKCFLKGKYGKHVLIVIPSFNLVVPGSDITKEKKLSPFLQQDLKNFEVYVVGDKVRYFGKLRNITS